jgi:hypothetical protein
LVKILGGGNLYLDQRGNANDFTQTNWRSAIDCADNAICSKWFSSIVMVESTPVA